MSTRFSLEERSAGLLLHPTSLPGPHGHGDLGPGAYAFADFLAEARQGWWQMLPVHPPEGGFSPYYALSAFAGSPTLISLDGLVRAGWLRLDEIVPPAALAKAGSTARFAPAHAFRESRLRKAFERFTAGARAPQRRALERFGEAHASWVDDYTLFAALRHAHGGTPWYEWPRPLRDRHAGAMARAARTHAEEIAFRRFLQFTFDLQWRELRAYCEARGVGLMGDVPIFVAPDSADVWAHRDLFFVGAGGRLPVVAGVPPDAFSSEGQRWGNPLYRWPVHRASGYQWWMERLRVAWQRFHSPRLDHFIGFYRYWEVPGTSPTARVGRFRPGPRENFFDTVLERFGSAPLIAEDLGIVIPQVEALRDRYSLPGMRLLQFAFDGGNADNPHLPHNHTRRCVVYTGTHDNDVLQGWIDEQVARRAKGKRAARGLPLDYALRYLDCPMGELHGALIRQVYGSVADTVILPVQDVLRLGSEARMNRPGTVRGNWAWRMQERALTRRHAERLAALVETYGRERATQGGKGG